MAGIYVADLAQYNNGRLVGEWIDIDGMSGDDIREAIGELMKKTGGEEWAVHDYDGLPTSFGEHPDFDALAQYVKMVEEHGDAWVAYVDHVGEHYATPEGFQDAYMGCYDSPADWAEQWLEDSGQLESIHESLRYYFDFEAYARDAGPNDGIGFVRLSGEVYVFRA